VPERSPRWRLLAALMALGALGGCGAKAPKPRPDTVIVRSPQEPDSLNPFLTGMSAATDAWQPIFSGLLTVDERMRFVPDLATEVPTPENGGVRAEGAGMVVTYRLRPGVSWHDGKPLTSRDVAFTARVLATPAVRVVEREGYDLVTRVDTPDALTARVHFKAVYAPYLKLFKAILPAHRLERSKDLNTDPFNRAPLGTGPFELVEWRAGERLLYRANPRYFRGRPGVEQLEIRVLPDDNAAFVQLKNGAIDVYQSVNLNQRDTLQRVPGVTVHETPALLWEHLSFNTESPFFRDARVRRAIAHAIDKELLSQKVYGGLWKPAWSDQNPLSWAYDPGLAQHTPFDPARARRLLDQAGWLPGPDGIRARDGRRFSITLATTAGKKNRETAQLLIRHFLREVGIDVRLDNHPGVTLFAAWPAGLLKSGRFEMAMWAWDTGPDPDNMNTWHSTRIPPRGANQTRFKHPEVDRLLVAATRTFRQAERQVIYRRISTILAQEAPNVPLLYWTSLDAVQARVKGFRPNPTSAGNLWNVWAWSLEPLTAP